jgi:hypothetical protein
MKKMENDYLNMPIFADIKAMVNEAIMQAIQTADMDNTNTVSIRFDVARDADIEYQLKKSTGERVKAFQPIEANIKINSKKELMNEKVTSETFTENEDAETGEIKIGKLQRSLFDDADSEGAE